MPADARKCPSCGVELETAGMAELEEVARDILDGKPEVGLEMGTNVPQSVPTMQTSDDPSPGNVPEVAAEESGEEPDSTAKGKGGFRRLFGRKKH
ncbi:MAG: hypothetical protein LUQ27_02080 [Methanomassiliicoccales archaeon]|nr:hypothetical protein [Methanomassiliicoccales archaeon]